MENIFIKIFSSLVHIFYIAYYSIKMITKDKIITASLNLFLKHGIRKMTMLKLVKEMDISTKTVYKYFADKEDLLAQCLLVHYKLLSSKLSTVEANATNPVVGIYRIWEGALELDFGINHIFYHDLNYYYSKMQDSTINKIFKKKPAYLYKFIEEGIQNGYFRNEINPHISIAAMETIYVAITRTDSFKQYKVKPEQILQNTMEPYIRGICTVKGIKAFEIK
jgi:AcrR family transcriptional regulator